MKELSLKKNIVYNSIGSFTNMFCQWVITFIVIRISGETASGVLALAMSFGSIFLIIAAFGVKTYQISDVQEKYTDREYIASKIVTCIIGLVAMFIWVGISSYYTEEKLASILYIIYMVIYSYADVLYGVQQRKWRLDIAGKSMCIRSILTLASFCLILFLTQNINITFVCMIIISLLVLLIYDFPQTRVLTNIRPDFNIRIIKGILFECFPLAAYALLHTLVLTVPKLFLREFYGQEFLGIYNPIMSPITVIAVVAGFVINPMITVFASHFHIGDLKNLFKDFMKCILLLVGLLVASLLGVYLFGDIILNILLGSGKSVYSYLLPPMVIVTILTSLTILAGNLCVVLRDIKGLIISGVLGYISAMGTSFIFVKKYDMIGTCYTLMIALGVQILIFTVSVALKLKKRRSIKGDNNI